ncbi:vWA domain-containing protein [uncultured Dokdonia sp.]|uniref:vWA domain-containing protein n=1 Tax=uncultured Dokdonia sp. TaxID=575653 RepID=UPI0030EE554F|tara:strand:- start:275528 stop:276697 length:1170 start_codon:yes stop_codon:yes gene_type:complete
MKTLFILAMTLALHSGLLVTNGNEDGHAFAKTEKNHTSSLKKDPAQNTIKVALLLDTSNSMDGLIDQARAQLWELVNELAEAKCGNESRPALKIALYEYGNDRLNAREGYIRMVNSFSTDLDEISKNLFSLTTNGGNEYCGNVIQNSLNQLEWGKNKNDLNFIFIAGNEPFDQGPVRYQDAASNACGKDVTINTIFCGDYNEGLNTNWKDGASLTQGDYIAINSDRATVHVPSPYDDKILQKNEELNKTYVGYGNLASSKLALQSSQDSNAQSYGNANAVKRAVSKSSRLYKNTSWDLVDAMEENEAVVVELKETSLPKELKGKTEKEIRKYVYEKKKQRTRIQGEIAKLNIKRKEFLESKTNTKDNELRNALVNAIKKQGRLKNYHWE